MARRHIQKSLARLNLKGALPIIFGLVVVGSACAAVPSASSPKVPNSHTQKVSSTSKKPAAASKVAAKPASVSPVNNVPAAKPVKALPATAAAPPVVVPAPTSSVDNLVPATTPNLPPDDTSTPQSNTPQVSPPAPVSYTSTNWSGYLSANGTYTSVSGSWNAPSATGTGVNTSADGTWIGIGGVTSGDLIQIGTDNTVTRSGQVITEAFYEMLPAVSQTVPGLTVSPGDAISASIVETASNQWLMTITNNTTNQTYSTTVSYTSSHSSAEWIEEDPSYSNGQQVPFDFFSTVSFTHATMVNNGTSLNLIGANASPITMVGRNGRPVATPSDIGTDGASFTVERSN